MKRPLIAVGKVKAPFAEADAHYRKLLKRHQPVEVIEVRDELNIEGRIPDRAHVVALDRGGRTLELARLGRMAVRAPDRRPDLCFLIGGPRGLPDEVLDARRRADLARAADDGPPARPGRPARAALPRDKILAGEPYHL